MTAPPGEVAESKDVTENVADDAVAEAEDAPEVLDEQRSYVLAKAIIRALTPGDGRSNRCKVGGEDRSCLGRSNR